MLKELTSQFIKLICQVVYADLTSKISFIYRHLDCRIHSFDFAGAKQLYVLSIIQD